MSAFSHKLNVQKFTTINGPHPGRDSSYLAGYESKINLLSRSQATLFPFHLLYRSSPRTLCSQRQHSWTVPGRLTHDAQTITGTESGPNPKLLFWTFDLHLVVTSVILQGDWSCNFEQNIFRREDHGRCLAFPQSFRLYFSEKKQEYNTWITISLAFFAHVHRARAIFALFDPDTDSGSADGAPLSGPHSRVWWQIGSYIQCDTNHILPQMTSSAEGSHCLTDPSKQKFLDWLCTHTLYFYLYLELLLTS